MMTFNIPGKPQGKARARTFYNPKLGRSQSITPEKTVLYENWIKKCFIAQCGSKPGYFDKEPLMIHICAWFEIPKSTSQKKAEQMAKGQLRPTKKLDADNIAKAVCDALNGLAYHDDTQVVDLQIIKRYTEYRPRVAVLIDDITLTGDEERKKR